MLLSRKNIPALNNIVTFQFLHGGVLLCTALFIICQRYFMLAGAPMGQERKIISHPVTLVTAYYPLSSGSKHSLEDYMKWTSNLFGHTRAPIVAYLPAGNISQTIREMRGDLPLTIKVLNLWGVPPVTKHRAVFEGKQYDIDPEKHIHSPALYAIWASKTWMLQQTAQQDPYSSDIFLWVDAGAWRARPFPSFPDVARIKRVFSRAPDRMLLGSPVLLQSGRPYIQGTFFGGPKGAIDWWSTEYYRVLDQWVSQGQFAGKDQELMVDIFERHSNRFLLLKSNAHSIGDPWFFFQLFLAADADLSQEEISVVQQSSDAAQNAKHALLVLGERA